MKIILKYIVTNVKERKLRTAVMLLSIVLSTMLLFVSFSVGESYESAQRKMARGMAGTATISVTAVNAKQTVNIKDIPNLDSIKAKVGILKMSAMYHDNGYYEEFELLGSELLQLNKINKPRLVNGGEITNFSGNQVILPTRFTSKYNINQGDKITLQINGESIAFEVSEIAAYDTIFLRNTRGTNCLLPLDTLAKLLGIKNGYKEVLIEPVKGTSTNDLIRELSEQLPADKYQVSAIVNETQITADARQKSMPFLLISFFALTMSVFIIYSSYKVITLERLPIIGTFRSIGATKKTVTRILMLESLLYGSLGGLLSIPIGIIVLKIMLHGLGTSITQGIEIPMVISTAGVILALTVAILVSLLSAYIPVRGASRLPVKDVVLGTVEDRHIPNRLKAWSGIVLFILSIILPRVVTGKSLYIVGGFSLLGLIAATIIVIPLLTALVSSVLERIYGVIFGNEGKLAARNMRDNKNIIQNITLLFISISAIIVISVVGNFVTTYVGDVFRGAKLNGFANGSMNQGFVDNVKNMKGIKNVLPIYVINNEVTGNNIAFSRVEATDNLEWYSSMFAINYVKDSKKEQAVTAFSKGRAIILSAAYMDKTGCTIGDNITLSNGKNSNKYKVVGCFKSRASDVVAVIPSNYAVTDFGVTNYELLAYTAADPEAIIIQIRDLFKDTFNWSRTVDEFTTDALGTVSAFLSPMHKMTYFILLLATVGIINNLLINYMQKRRSIAMYKSVGLSNMQNIKMTLIEGVSSGLIGSLIGILVSYTEIKTVFIVAGPKIAMSPELDIGTFLFAGIVGVVVTLIGSVVPILKGNRMKLVKEIKFE